MQISRNMSRYNTIYPSSKLGLIISYEGLANPIIESQVLEHANLLSRNGISCEVWLLCGTKKMFKESELRLKVIQMNHLVKIRLLRSVWHNLPMSEYFNAYILYKQIIKSCISVEWIHARTEYVGMVCAFLKKYIRFKLILDIRGDTLSEILLETSKRSFLENFFLKIKFHLEDWRGKIVKRKADAAIFVSKELKRIYERKGYDLPTQIIPCVVISSLFYFDIGKRKNMRKKLGYSDSDIVICYSGSTEVWQCADETIQLIKYFMKEYSNISAIILSKQKEKFRQLVGPTFENKFTFIYAEFHEVNDYLNAADFAVLLREKHVVNYVASPVKFAEYSTAGLYVITTDAVEQVVEYGSMIGNIIIHNDEDKWDKLYELFDKKDINRAAISHNARKLYDRNNYVQKIHSLYSGGIK
jgi:hypothetical protein